MTRTRTGKTPGRLVAELDEQTDLSGQIQSEVGRVNGQSEGIGAFPAASDVGRHTQGVFLLHLPLSLSPAFTFLPNTF